MMTILGSTDLQSEVLKAHQCLQAFLRFLVSVINILQFFF